MKNFVSLFLVALLMCIAFAAFAAPPGKVLTDPNGKVVGTFSPHPAASACTTTTTTKGAIATVNVAGYSKLCWEASDSSNAAKRIKRHLGSSTAYMPGTGGCIGLNSGMSSVAFKPYSGASAEYTVCVELEKGGKTP